MIESFTNMYCLNKAYWRSANLSIFIENCEEAQCNLKSKLAQAKQDEKQLLNSLIEKNSKEGQPVLMKKELYHALYESLTSILSLSKSV